MLIVAINSPFPLPHPLPPEMYSQPLFHLITQAVFLLRCERKMGKIVLLSSNNHNLLLKIRLFYVNKEV